jgi:hypothetical protein
MPDFGPASAPVASWGVLEFLEASSSYKIDYNAMGQSKYPICIRFILLPKDPRTNKRAPALTAGYRSHERVT